MRASLLVCGCALGACGWVQRGLLANLWGLTVALVVDLESVWGVFLACIDVMLPYLSFFGLKLPLSAFNYLFLLLK